MLAILEAGQRDRVERAGSPKEPHELAALGSIECLAKLHPRRASNRNRMARLILRSG